MPTKEILVSGEMHNPPHPGEVIRILHIEPTGLTVTEAAQRLGIDRKTLSRVINGHAKITVDMAMRLSKALNTSAKVWLGMQQSYDIWQAKNNKKTDLSKVKTWLVDYNENRPVIF